MKVIAIAKNTFRETVRDKIFYNLLIFYIAMMSISILLGGMSIGEDEKIIKDLGLSGMAIFGALITIFIGISLINREVDRHTIFTVLSKPVSRAEFILGKFAGLSTLVVVNLVLMTLCLIFILYGVTGKLETSILLPLPFMFVEFLLLAALAIMFSSFSTPTLSALFTISLYVLGHLSPEIRDLGAKGHGAFSSITSAVYRVIPNLEAMNLREEVVHSLQVDWSMVVISIVYGLLYTVALLVISVFIFGRKDLR